MGLWWRRQSLPIVTGLGYTASGEVSKVFSHCARLGGVARVARRAPRDLLALTWDRVAASRCGDGVSADRHEVHLDVREVARLNTSYALVSA